MLVPILMYHQVDPPPPRGTPMRGLVVAPHTFAWQMRMLKWMGYQGLSMREALPYLQGRKQGRVAAITFDDGYRNNLEYAAPLLADLGFSATCYAVSRLAGRDNAWDAGLGVPSKPLMDANQMRAWCAAGMEIGAHTRDHLDLTSLSPQAARDQIVGSRADLEDMLGEPVSHFCYPYGRYRSDHVALAQEAGYLSATTVNRGRAVAGSDLFTLPRVLVSRATHPGYFLLKLATAYEDRRGH
jgi:peptidoglycan/xylan/chitin deacetylase (PgdA/CDA1 family)